MRQRGRKKPSTLAAVTQKSVEVLRRFDPPEDFSVEEREIWNSVIEAVPNDWFTKANLPLLIQYCRHVDQSRYISTLLAMRDAVDTDGYLVLTLKDYDKLLQMQDRETKAITSLATRMRISQQSVTNHRGNGKPTSRVAKPWMSDD